MNIYTMENIPQSVINQAIDLSFNDNRLSMAASICKVLTLNHGIQYTCFGGTPAFPITEFRHEAEPKHKGGQQ